MSFCRCVLLEVRAGTVDRVAGGPRGRGFYLSYPATRSFATCCLSGIYSAPLICLVHSGGRRVVGWPMNSITPALNSAGRLLWLAYAMFSRLTSGRSSSSLSVTAVRDAGLSAPETSSVRTRMLRHRPRQSGRSGP